MQNIGDQIKDIAKGLFEKGEIDLFIGYEAALEPFRSRPYFIRSKEGTVDNPVDKLTWNSFCSNNLSVFLPKLFEIDPRSRQKDPKPRVAIVAKACDLRSIVSLSKENQASRDNLVLIGVPCSGMIDRKKVEELVPGDEILTLEESDEGITVNTRNGKTVKVGREDVLQECCIECRTPSPPADSVDIPVEGEAKEPGDGGYARVKEFESRTPAERWAYFEREMSKCIRCNACRQACPNCWCKECFADQDDLRWIGTSTEISDTMAFHLIRVFHQAGRCVECDACYRACPMGVDLRTFTQKIAKDVHELFDYVPGFDLEEAPPLSTFAEGDSEEFITDPE